MLETKKKFSQLRIHGAEISSAAISRSHHALLLRAVRSEGDKVATHSVFGTSVSPISTGALGVEIGFYVDIFCDSRCNIEIRVSRTGSRPEDPEAGPRHFGGRGRSGLTL